MIEQSEKPFPHRHNADRTWDSICPECFRTVAHCRSRTELAAHEQGHVCPPDSPRNFRRDWRPQPLPPQSGPS
jgi:hypothetical protein